MLHLLYHKLDSEQCIGFQKLEERKTVEGGAGERVFRIEVKV